MGIVHVATFPRQPAGPYPPDRTCAHPDCETVLRTTNAGPCCEQCAVTPYAAWLVSQERQAA